MPRTNRHWLPSYCNPDSYLPKVQETRTLFASPPYLFREFVGKAVRYLQSDSVRKMGFEYDPHNALPCKWKCADESIFAVDLALYAHTNQFPFDKGSIGGRFNSAALRAAVKHGKINLDFGGSHVGYQPGENGGSFGEIWRPLHHSYSTDCGYLCAVMEPFRTVYEDACANIYVMRPEEERFLLSIPNEYIHPSWDNNPIKLMVDTDALTDGSVAYDPKKPHTQTPIGRTLFYLKPGLLNRLDDTEATRFHSPTPQAIGRNLTHPFFNIFNTSTTLDEHGLPEQKLELYMKYILSARTCPPSLKAAIVNTNLEYNRLTDAVRDPIYKPYSFASFTGVFIDMYDREHNAYLNLFQPLGISIKPADTTSMVEIPAGQIHEIFAKLEPAEPLRSIREIMGFETGEGIVDKFTFKPGSFDK